MYTPKGRNRKKYTLWMQQKNVKTAVFTTDYSQNIVF